MPCWKKPCASKWLLKFWLRPSCIPNSYFISLNPPDQKGIMQYPTIKWSWVSDIFSQRTFYANWKYRGWPIVRVVFDLNSIDALSHRITKIGWLIGFLRFRSFILHLEKWRQELQPGPICSASQRQKWDENPDFWFRSLHYSPLPEILPCTSCVRQKKP